MKDRQKNFSIEFGKPVAGWLPVHCKIHRFELHFEASDVPVNPVELLCDALISMLQAKNAEVWWFLEPRGYNFEFALSGPEITLTISDSDGDKSSHILKKFTGDFESLILPLYKAFRLFVNRSYPEEDWPSIDERKIEDLEKILAKK